ncbi:MAG: hypothetical protein A2172_02260 [Candidatus Woykebacteria bacterium RBG_13_40_15]|uniref:ParB/Sulfiredoxin domain-containing protein n=1 Tax=Candidatus Woykebacteria bacterium RBG_13_40_15 TaxID=1802593 RepID=A0A1G1W6H2_9BACT|nr:MAG: hypothetical protein A2172_02260 [Candidatus Woykebacteria bacterium RBG_13_40_15]
MAKKKAAGQPPNEADFTFPEQDTKLDFRVINTVSQPRKEFPDIRELADSIARHGLLYPLVILKLDEEQCRKYLGNLNAIWESEHCIEELTVVREGKKRIFYLLLAGERRLRAYRHLWKKGCSDCLEVYGKEKRGTCFRRHISVEGMIPTRICENMPIHEALILQMIENTSRVQLSLNDEARGLAYLYRTFRMADPALTVKDFARHFGRGETTVRSALRFCKLPPEIQGAVDNGNDYGKLEFGIAVQLARLQEHGCDEEELLHRMKTAQLDRTTVPDFRQSVTSYLQFLRGQGCLFDSDVSRRLAALGQHKQIVERHILGALYTQLQYMLTVIRLFENGDLGMEDSPFSVRSPVKVYLRVVQTLAQALPHMRQFLPEKDLAMIGATLAEGLEVTRILEAALAEAKETGTEAPGPEEKEVGIPVGAPGGNLHQQD